MSYKLTKRSTLRSIVNAFPDRWKRNLRKARAKGEPIVAGYFYNSHSGGRCLMGIAFDANKPDFATKRYYQRAEKFFGDHSWFSKVDRLIKKSDDPWKDIYEALKPTAKPQVRSKAKAKVKRKRGR